MNKPDEHRLMKELLFLAQLIVTDRLDSIPVKRSEVGNATEWKIRYPLEGGQIATMTLAIESKPS